MLIDADVAQQARFFGIDAKLIQAVVNAEGDILQAVRCSVPTITTRLKAIEITCRSAVGAMSDFVQHTFPGPIDLRSEFVKFWAARWAPQGVSNDPHNLNANWPKNVLSLWVTP